jgi:hypothetical protein
MPGLYKDIFANLQQDPRMTMHDDGIFSLDEHVIPHSSDEMEGVDWFYSTTEEKTILGVSTITMHYFRDGVEYPVNFSFYRRWEELEKHGATDLYKEKNQIAREMLEAACAQPGAPNVVVMDSFFMTKENVRLLLKLHRDYVSRPKRNWNCTIEHVKYTFGSLFDTIPASEFKRRNSRIQRLARQERNGLPSELFIYQRLESTGSCSSIVIKKSRARKRRMKQKPRPRQPVIGSACSSPTI